jgi:hypothetical protein
LYNILTDSLLSDPTETSVALRGTTVQGRFYSTFTSPNKIGIATFASSWIITDLTTCALTDVGYNKGVAAAAVPGTTFDAVALVHYDGPKVFFINQTTGNVADSNSLRVIDSSTFQFSNVPLGFPLGARLFDRKSDDLLLLKVDVLESNWTATVIATRENSTSPNFRFRYLSSTGNCFNSARANVVYSKFRSDGTLGVLAVQNGTFLFAYLYNANSTEIVQPIKTLNSSSTPLMWNLDDIPGSGGLPVVFQSGSSAIRMLARVDAPSQAEVYLTDPSAIAISLYSGIRTPAQPLIYAAVASANAVDEILFLKNSTAGVAFLNSSGLFDTDYFIVNPTKKGYITPLSPSRVLVTPDYLANETSVYLYGNVVEYASILPDNLRLRSSLAPFFGPRSLITIGVNLTTGLLDAAIYKEFSLFRSRPAFLALPMGVQFKSASLCGVWTDGLVVVITTSEPRTMWYHWRISADILTQEIADSDPEAGKCHMVPGTSLFIFSMPSQLVYFNPATGIPGSSSAGPNYRIIPGAIAMPVPGQRGYKLVASLRDIYSPILDPFDSILYRNSLCASDLDCGGALVCNPSVFACTAAPRPIAPGCQGLAPTPNADCINGLWVILGPVIVTNTTIFAGNTKIVGSLTITAPNATVIISGGSKVEVTECATFAGNLKVSIDAPTTTQINQTITVIAYEGYCNGVATKFNNTSLEIVGEEACAKREGDALALYTDRSLSIVFTYDRSGCESPAVAGIGGALSVGAIAGIVVGAVVLVAVVVGLVLLLKYKNVIRPFSSRVTTTDHELD